MSFNPTALKIRYKNTDTDSLIRIVNFEADNLLPEAIEIARLELQERGVSSSNQIAIETIKAEIEVEIQHKQALAEIPLNDFLKIICFLFCDIVAVIIALSLSSAGKKKAAKQAWVCFGYGWLVRLVFFLLGLLAYFTHPH